MTKIYIQFDEKGNQIAATTSETCPGDDWQSAPDDFSWKARYRLEGADVVRVPDEEVQKAEADMVRTRALNELTRLLTETLRIECGTSLEALTALQAEAQLVQNVVDHPDDAALQAQIQPLLDAEGLGLEGLAEKTRSEAAKATKLLILTRATDRKIQRQLSTLITAEEITKTMDDLLKAFAAEIKGGANA